MNHKYYISNIHQEYETNVYDCTVERIEEKEDKEENIINTNNILYIKWNNNEMKCKYVLLFTIDDNGDIIWSHQNEFIDQKTRYISNSIYNSIIDMTTFNVNIIRYNYLCKFIIYSR